ncbi:MAG: MBOAT family protein, partial [Clostridia bacterium]|nr:MBOAT family protein [Clostridia bacterium]
LGAMVGFGGLWDGDTWYLLMSNLFPFAVMTCSALGYFRKFPKLRNANVRLALQAVGYAAVLALCVVSLVSDTYNPFLYFRF